MGAPFDVHDLRCGLVVDRVPMAPHGKTVIGVLIITRPVSLVEATQFKEEAAGSHQKGTRAVVGFTHESIWGGVRIRVVSPQVRRGAIPVNDSACLLQAA